MKIHLHDLDRVSKRHDYLILSEDLVIRAEYKKLKNQVHMDTEEMEPLSILAKDSLQTTGEMLTGECVDVSAREGGTRDGKSTAKSSVDCGLFGLPTSRHLVELSSYDYGDVAQKAVRGLRGTDFGG